MSTSTYRIRESELEWNQVILRSVREALIAAALEAVVFSVMLLAIIGMRFFTVLLNLWWLALGLYVLTAWAHLATILPKRDWLRNLTNVELHLTNDAILLMNTGEEMRRIHRDQVRRIRYVGDAIAVDYAIGQDENTLEI